MNTNEILENIYKSVDDTDLEIQNLPEYIIKSDKLVLLKIIEKLTTVILLNGDKDV